MRCGFSLPLTICSIYVFALFVASVMVMLEQFVPNMPWSGVFGVGVAIFGFPLAALHLTAIVSRDSRAAAVESIVFAASFLMGLAPIAASWPGLPHGPLTFQPTGLYATVTILNFLSALTMAFYSERWKPVAADHPAPHGNPEAEVFAHLANKKSRPCVRPLRRMGIIMLLISLMFYMIGSDTERGRALLGLIASVIVIANSYLIACWNHRGTPIR
jgi:hypothetical protein